MKTLDETLERICKLASGFVLQILGRQLDL
jgi:hypothetical protein